MKSTVLVRNFPRAQSNNFYVLSSPSSISRRYRRVLFPVSYPQRALLFWKYNRRPFSCTRPSHQLSAGKPAGRTTTSSALRAHPGTTTTTIRGHLSFQIYHPTPGILSQLTNGKTFVKTVNISRADLRPDCSSYLSCDV